MHFVKKTLAIASLTVISAAALAAQDAFDASKVPSTGAKVADFVPRGWKIEADVTGDLNDDKKADHALKLIEDKPTSEDTMVERKRVLVLLFTEGDGTLKKAAVTDRLLQCTSCGGAFYGAMDAPAEVSIEKGVLIVSQEHGSRWVTETTYRFRYDEQPAMFILIGFDYASRDRAKGDAWTESTNYLTGKRITTIGKGKRTTKKTTTVTKMRHSIEEVDYEEFDAAATKRLGLD